MALPSLTLSVLNKYQKILKDERFDQEQLVTLRSSDNMQNQLRSKGILLCHLVEIISYAKAESNSF